MDSDNHNLLKSREIRFFQFHPDARQAHSAALFLNDIQGIDEARPQSDTVLHVRYDLSQITLAAIDSALTELGFHLNTTLMDKFKRALYYYTEEAECANYGLKPCSCSDNSLHVYISRYQSKQHGCRDTRPPHWRNYL